MAKLTFFLAASQSPIRRVIRHLSVTDCLVPSDFGMVTVGVGVLLKQNVKGPHLCQGTADDDRAAWRVSFVE
jgi:hypothetical protein